VVHGELYGAEDPEADAQDPSAELAPDPRSGSPPSGGDMWPLAGALSEGGLGARGGEAVPGWDPEGDVARLLATTGGRRVAAMRDGAGKGAGAGNSRGGSSSRSVKAEATLLVESSSFSAP
jgi:hypothetical protein